MRFPTGDAGFRPPVQRGSPRQPPGLLLHPRRRRNFPRSSSSPSVQVSRAAAAVPQTQALYFACAIYFYTSAQTVAQALNRVITEPSAFLKIEPQA